VRIQHLYVVHFPPHEELLLRVQEHLDLVLRYELLQLLRLRSVSVLGQEIEYRGIFHGVLKVNRNFPELE
jgi:hypothetical protein